MTNKHFSVTNLLKIKPMPEMRGYLGPDTPSEFVCMKEGKWTDVSNNKALRRLYIHVHAHSSTWNGRHIVRQCQGFSIVRTHTSLLLQHKSAGVGALDFLLSTKRYLVTC
jgi:hypothetical protein